MGLPVPQQVSTKFLVHWGKSCGFLGLVLSLNSREMTQKAITKGKILSGFSEVSFFFAREVFRLLFSLNFTAGPCST